MRTIQRLKLKELREDHGISQGDIAAKAKVTQAFLSLVESGRRPASKKLKQVLIDQFHVDNLEDYEIEVETDDVKSYSFLNNGQYIDGQSGGTATYYDMKGQQPSQPQEPQQSPQNPPNQSSAATVDVLTEVVKDYLNKNGELQRAYNVLLQEKQDLEAKYKVAIDQIANLDNEVKRLKNKIAKATNK